jgi:hypothetical protein
MIARTAIMPHIGSRPEGGQHNRPFDIALTDWPRCDHGMGRTRVSADIIRFVPQLNPNRKQDFPMSALRAQNIRKLSSIAHREVHEKSPRQGKNRIRPVRSIGCVAVVSSTEQSSVTLRKSLVEIIVAASILIFARLAFDFTSAAAYVYPEFDFGQSGIAFVIFLVAVPRVLIFALVRLFQKHFVEAVALLIVCCIPFSFNDIIKRHFWKFRIHKPEYQSILHDDPAPSPKYRVFNWGNRNTQLMGGGFIIEGIVYDETDETDEIARWSPEWIERRSDPSPEDRWVTERSTYPSCKRRADSFGEHFYYVSEEC